ncbi:MAG TPA: FAD-dependent thymidylate synthase [Thermomicrobiales bacterium]|nr:FAD-dependent thymidylate synthase [Thermomicrobiales bacterium]
MTDSQVEPTVEPRQEAEALQRVSVPELDAVLGKPFPVLDQGFVRVVDYMGTDSSIVQAARVSYGTGTKRVREDRGLIRYLMRHEHTTPFEMCDIKLHVKVPMDIWRQWIRHRTASVNEYSTRYSIAIDEAHRVQDGAWRAQSTSNRQGSEGLVDGSLVGRLSEREGELQDLAREVYQERLDAGVAREQARKDLPLSTYTEAYWKTNLHNLLHFVHLRMDDHAQWEIQEYARTIGEQIISRWCPVAWEAFLDYRVNTMSFSDPELACLTAIMAGNQEAAVAAALDRGLLRERNGERKPTREGSEFAVKLSRMGLEVPWA